MTSPAATIMADIAAPAAASVFADTSAVVVVTEPDSTEYTLSQPMLGAVTTGEREVGEGEYTKVYNRTLRILRSEIDRPIIGSTVTIDDDPWYIDEVLRQGSGLTAVLLYQSQRARTGGTKYRGG